MMEIIRALTEDQIRTALLIGISTGKPVGGYTIEDLQDELDYRTGNGADHTKEDTPPKPIIKGLEGAAEYLGCGVKTVDRNLERIPHYKLGRAYYFQPEALDRIKKRGGI